MSKKTYILKKKWLYLNPGTILIHSGDSNNYYKEITGNVKEVKFPADFVENNPEWFLLKEDEGITVKSIHFAYSEREETDMAYRLMLSKKIPLEKIDAVKKAIEFVLNNVKDFDPEYYGLFIVNKDIKIVTDKELLYAEQKAFYAGRAKVIPMKGRVNTNKYFNFTHYKNATQNKQQ